MTTNYNVCKRCGCRESKLNGNQVVCKNCGSAMWIVKKK